jgi:hypothetical protein
MMETIMIMTAGTPQLKTKSSQSGTVSCTVKGKLERISLIVWVKTI